MSVLGTNFLRRDARERISGAIKYTEDFIMPDMLHAVLVRSEVAAGTIKEINCDAARKLDGIVCILTAADLPDRPYGNFLRDQPILARGVVRYAGEPVAMIAATSLRAARKASKLVEVHIDPVPCVLDLVEAAEPHTTPVHSDRSNIIDTARIVRGDVETAFTQAHKIVTTRIETHRVHQGYLEPRGVTAMPAGDGLTLIMSTQQPFGVRIVLSELFEIAISKIEVRVPAVGGGFGGKLHVGYAPHAAALALATGRPVQLICERGEDMRNGSPRENSVVEMSSAVDAEGRLLARKCAILLDSGAYALDIQALNSMAAFYATGPYYIENIDLTSRAVYTNTCPTGSFRGPTGPQLVYAGETHLDEIASAMGLGCDEIRRRNFIRKGQRGPGGELMSEVTIEECMDRALGRLREFRSDEIPNGDRRKRGYGFACTWWSSLGTPSSAVVQVHDDGSATVSSGGTEIGTSVISTTLPAIVSEVLGIDPERVSLNSGSTRDAPFESGSRGSRTLFSTGNATLRALTEVVTQIKEEASEMCGVPVENLVLRDGRVEGVGQTNASLPLSDVVSSARMRSGPVVASARYKATPSEIEGSRLENARVARLGEATFHCHGVEIAFDDETGRIEVLRYVAVHDVGRILNPLAARGQVEGGVVQGIGYALYENLEIDKNGAVRNDNFHDYRMPTIADVPKSIETIFIETNESATGPFGAKGIGEPPVIIPAAAIGSALRDLFGQQPHRLPFDPGFMVDFVDQAAAKPV
ncbi:xanthine dehydrogenase family protein molybdopterin-binding subunit [Brucella gallinifaecis]|uniref:xanthine dehydrogenase family protein molybdopterin-binding subunit n=1 Tax=Brucella gallinifaecis TaxID=215590 RepID=UPI0023610517|nr:xanthine dehydrogenase family protein molybdopterin-binding subunit [Brucella gallinifaecis]